MSNATRFCLYCTAIYAFPHGVYLINFRSKPLEQIRFISVYIS